MKTTKIIQADLNNAISAISDGISCNSKTLSKVFRYVFFALLAFVWGLLINDSLIDFNGVVITFFVLMVTYFIIDILQYFILLVKYINHGEWFEYSINIGHNCIMRVINDEKRFRKRINKLSYCFFYAKAVVLFAALAFFLIIIINVLL